MPNIAFAALISMVLIAGCASTKVETTGTIMKEPFCYLDKPAVSTLVYWGPKWRPDQKEPQRREVAALQGIESFLKHAGCIEVTGIHRLSLAKQPQSNKELLKLLPKSSPKPERVLFIVVRELGPRIEIGIPIILEGGTEVLIDVKVLNPQTSDELANTQTLWRNGGKFVIKGIKTLDQDISSALTAVLMPGVSNE